MEKRPDYTGQLNVKSMVLKEGGVEKGRQNRGEEPMLQGGPNSEIRPPAPAASVRFWGVQVHRQH